MLHPNRSIYESLEAEEAAARAREAVRALSRDLKGEDAVVVAAAIKDVASPSPFPHQGIYREIARNAGFAAETEVRSDRRGYLHKIVVCRVHSEGPKVQAAATMSLR